MWTASKKKTQQTNYPTSSKKTRNVKQNLFYLNYEMKW